MLTQYTGEKADDLPIIVPGIKYNRGAGIRMAMEIGAATAGQFDMVHAELVDPRAKNTPLGHLGPELRHRGQRGKCERFHDEGEDYHFTTTESIAYDTWRHQNQKSYFITDKTVMDRFKGSWVYQTTDTAGTVRHHRWPGRETRPRPDEAEATVSEFNAACGPGDWDPTKMDGKKTSGITPPKSNWAKPIAEAPFSGFPMTTQLKFTFGGLKVDTDGRLLNTKEAPIPGLYAAGEITGLYDKHPPATSVLRANTFGRIVGTNVAESLSAAPRSIPFTAVPRRDAGRIEGCASRLPAKGVVFGRATRKGKLPWTILTP